MHTPHQREIIARMQSTRGRQLDERIRHSLTLPHAPADAIASRTFPGTFPPPAHQSNSPASNPGNTASPLTSGRIRFSTAINP